MKQFIVSDDDSGVFGEGKWRLLKAIHEHGSILSAAQSLDRSYRKAWGDIKNAESALGQPLVCKSRGGSGGGKSVLTGFCIELIAAWERYREENFKAVEKNYCRILKPLLENSLLAAGGVRDSRA